MAASREARFAPIGAFRGGLALMLFGALCAWGPLDVPTWAWMGLLCVGGLMVAVALGIRAMDAN